MTTHQIKALPREFKAVSNWEKNFLLRKDDKGYEVGDILEVREYTPAELYDYTGRKEYRKVSYIMRNCPEYGLMEGYCILGFEVDQTEEGEQTDG